MFLPMFGDNVLQFFLTLVALCTVLVTLIPLVAVALLAGMPFFLLQTIAVEKTNREVKRMANAANAPILSTITECSGGRSTIAIMRLEPYFNNKFQRQIDEYNRFNFLSSSLINWGMLVSYAVSLVISTLAAVILLQGRRTFDPAVVGLSLTYSFMFPYYLLYFSFNFSFAMMYLTCLERLLQYSNTNEGKKKIGLVPIEPQWTLPSDPGSAWPEKAKIVFSNIKMRYKGASTLALDGVSFEVAAGEKIGIVGRTGAGKSSLILLLFRILDAESGAVYLDGNEITKVGLQVLRRAMGIIPQNPLLIAGSVKHNLDPFNQHPIEQLQQVMQKVGLPIALLEERESVPDASQSPKAKKAHIKESEKDGGNAATSLSAGQQQLLSFARVLLRRMSHGVKIVVMDEPTSNIDKDTDERLQKLARTELEECTVLTIAHRLGTVIDYDRIMVMGAGKVLEFDTPSKLLENTSGELSRMVDAMGSSAAAALKIKANEAASCSSQKKDV